VGEEIFPLKMHIQNPGDDVVAEIFFWGDED
jgi:hypothetical protein